MLALLSLEVDPEGLLERLPNYSKRPRSRGLEESLRITRIRREEPRDIVRVGDSRASPDGPFEKAEEALADCVRRRRCVPRRLPKLGCARRKREVLDGCGLSIRVLRDEDELPKVGHEHLTVLAPVLLDLCAQDCLRDFLGRALRLDDAAGGPLSPPRLRIAEALELLRGEEPTVRHPGTLVCEAHDAADSRLQVPSYLVYEAGERAVVGEFLHARTRGVNLS